MENMKNTTCMVWHYAPWAYLGQIVDSGFIKGSNAGAPTELPMLWFSANQQWEPTATKMWVSPNGQRVAMSFSQQNQSAGCIRFGLPSDDPRLMNWKDACTKAGTPRADRRGMEAMGKKKGANPAHWFATAVNVPLDELRFQIYLKKQWMDAECSKEMADVWAKAGSTAGAGA